MEILNPKIMEIQTPVSFTQMWKDCTAVIGMEKVQEFVVTISSPLLGKKKMNC